MAPHYRLATQDYLDAELFLEHTSSSSSLS